MLGKIYAVIIRSSLNRSTKIKYLNFTINRQRRKILVSEIIAALRADNQDPDYQTEIVEWDRLAGDGIDA